MEFDDFRAVLTGAALLVGFMLLTQGYVWYKFGAEFGIIFSASFRSMAIAVAVFCVWYLFRSAIVILIGVCIAWLNWFPVLSNAEAQLFNNVALSFLHEQYGPWWNGATFKWGVLALIIVATLGLTAKELGWIGK